MWFKKGLIKMYIPSSMWFTFIIGWFCGIILGKANSKSTKILISIVAILLYAIVLILGKQ